MIVPRLRLAELLRRLGVQQINREPMPLAEVVSPCVVVGDLREHVPPVLAPRAVLGGAPVTGGANFAAFALQSRAQGGTVVNFGVWFSIPGNVLRFRISAAAAPAFAAATLALNQDYGGSPTVAVLNTGEVAATILTAAHPTIISNLVMPPIYLPQGFTFYGEAAVAAGSHSWFFDIQEFAFPPAT